MYVQQMHDLQFSVGHFFRHRGSALNTQPSKVIAGTTGDFHKVVKPPDEQILVFIQAV